MSSSKHSALASLTATYTDSENEDGRHTDEEYERSDGESSSTQERSRQQTPNREQFSENSATPPQATDQPANVGPEANVPSEAKQPPVAPARKKALRLVSYIDDTVVTDDENATPHREEHLLELSDGEPTEPDPVLTLTTAALKKLDRSKLYGFSLPPEPKGKCSQELQEKVNKDKLTYEKMKDSSKDANRLIQERKEFRNPSIYEKLIQFCDINELGTNYPPEIFDPSQWGKESYYEELAKAQKIEMEKVEKARKEGTKTEIQIGVKRMDPDESKKRKSKWDQPGVLGAAPGLLTAAAVVNALKPAGLLQQPLTTTATGTKGTVISAFGSLPKKPKV